MLENLKLDRIIVHEVLTASDFRKRKPKHSGTTIEVNAEGKELICQRLVEAIGSASHCEEMLVADESETSSFQSIVGLLDSKAENFASTTASLSDRLSGAQTGGSVKEGLGVFLQGTGMEDGQELRWTAILKADPDQGMVSEVENEKIVLRYVANLIMGAQQRLLKVALFTEVTKPQQSTARREGTDFSIKLYDHLLNKTGRGESAQYFYFSFLGLKPAENSAKWCRLFFEKTREFTDSLSADDEEKVKFRGHLVSYLRSEREQISAKAFADDYIPAHHRAAYLKTMKTAEFPTHAVHRDISLIKSKLRKQSLHFTSKITLVGSDDALQKAVQFGSVVDVDGEDWTELKIKGKLE